MGSPNEVEQTSHTCGVCSRSFTRIENLKRHQKTHQNNLPHRCMICQKRFSRSDLLKKHQRLHQKLEKEDSLREEHELSSAKKVDYSFIIEDPNPLSSLSRNRDRETGIAHLPLVGNSRLQHLNAGHAMNKTPRTSHAASSVLSPSCVAFSRPQDTTATTSVLGANVDFSYFVQHWQDSLWVDSSQWFTPDFYDAVRETSHISDPFILQDDSMSLSAHWNWLGQYPAIPGSSAPQLTTNDVQVAPLVPAEISDGPESISRVNSPPNVPSREDGVAFAWNPSSKSLCQTHSISINESHPLMILHNPQFDIIESTWIRVQEFLELETPGSENLIPPSLAVANVFLGLFFDCFYEQSPVLHLPTLSVDHLPASLLSAMIIIGATYSRIRHTRRFSIIMLNRARQNLQVLIEADKSLTRHPETIYASSLLVYTGLWCGNKGAFETAEASRGSLVTYVRRLFQPKSKVADAAGIHVEDRWRAWAKSEFKRRLRWYVFMIDSQFPAILNMRSMMSLAEVSRWECPGDDAAWCTTSPLTWEALVKSLGSSPAPEFGVVYKALTNNRRAQSTSLTPSVPLITDNISPWTQFLVLSSLASQALDWSHDWSVQVGSDLAIVQDMNSDCHQEGLRIRDNIIASLKSWECYYGTKHSGNPISDGAQSLVLYFQKASQILRGLINIQLHTCVADLQDALGKGGANAVDESLGRLRIYFTNGYTSCVDSHQEPPFESLDAFAKSVIETTSIMSNPTLQSATPYSIFGVFLNHVLQWAFLKSSPETLKSHLRRHLQDIAFSYHGQGISELTGILDFGLSSADPTGINRDRSHLVLMQAAQNLALLGTWGASLNLALLLQLRAKT
ncbi:C2H2 type zinc finger domain protein [Colletotrichum scovillei]|uniref:C2H2 type zinc finger domain protein n=1 Tax=Colletotrichum scovillei TaxID=1209932 RepID=A0A9P7QR01_9PEZI|nr:C2H2 type zinc finger domain protein [Colletotrichum scovillei]KAG7040958.1 C2H2 type zinc finger domain protein [Colletotrichum scovillei]KAG7060990.1 C2H2 type zinc finger domain protein [Colletotrichum scovillei]